MRKHRPYYHHKKKDQLELTDFPETKEIVQDHFDSLAKCNEVKMVDLNEVAPQVPLFEGSEKVEKKDVLNKKLIVDAYAEMTGDKDEKFGVIRFTLNGKSCTTSITSMMLERLNEGVEKVGVNAEKSTPKEKVLAQTLEVTIVSKISQKNNKEYYYFKGNEEETKKDEKQN